MEIKKLSKEIIQEGITLEMVNSPLFYEKCSPVILRKDEETVKLVCINQMEKERRYWIIDSDGKYVKDGNSLFVISEKEARIGRARFLVLHGAEEEASEREKFYKRVDDQVEKWKQEIDKEIKKFYYNLQVEKCLANQEFDNVENSLFSVKDYCKLLKQNQTEYQIERAISRAQTLWKAHEDLYNDMDEYVAKNDYYSLAQICRKIPENKMGIPILTAHYNNPVEMENFKKVLGKDAIDHFAGDMLKIYAAIYLTKK